MPEQVSRRELGGWLSPLQVFSHLNRTPGDIVWLDAGEHSSQGFSYLGWAGTRAVEYSARTGLCTLFVTGREQAQRQSSIFEFLETDIAARSTALQGAETAKFNLGWVGWLGYELAAETIGANIHPSRHADAAFTWVDAVLEFDHAARVIRSVALHEGGHSALAQVYNTVRAERATAPSADGDGPHLPAMGDMVWRHADEQYLQTIKKAQQHIGQGDAYLLCLTNTLSISEKLNAEATYEALRASSSTHHGGFVRINDVALLSASPEVFLNVDSNRVVRTKPIKGTRPRSSDAEADAALVAELQGDEKERAENLMIVDLMRNDIGRIAQVGTVNVEALLAVESYAHVHQLVSTVSAKLLPGETAVSAAAAIFPAGSMTGAPKKSAINILSQLEDAPRGIYSGAFGYFALDGAADLAMVIRSIVIDGEGASIGAGGGITAESNPFAELAEVKLKAQALNDALRLRL